MTTKVGCFLFQLGKLLFPLVNLWHMSMLSCVANATGYPINLALLISFQLIVSSPF